MRNVKQNCDIITNTLRYGYNKAYTMILSYVDSEENLVNKEDIISFLKENKDKIVELTEQELDGFSTALYNVVNEELKSLDNYYEEMFNDLLEGVVKNTINCLNKIGCITRVENVETGYYGDGSCEHYIGVPFGCYIDVSLWNFPNNGFYELIEVIGEDGTIYLGTGENSHLNDWCLDGGNIEDLIELNKELHEYIKNNYRDINSVNSD